MKDGFFTSYYGNKWKETKQHFDLLSKMIDWKEVKYIVEPFCGSAGFSRYVYFNCPDFKGSFIWADIDTGLISFLQEVKAGKFSEMCETIKKAAESIEDKEGFKKYRTDVDRTTGLGWFATNKIRGGFRADLYNAESLESVKKRKYDGLKPLEDLVKSDRVLLRNQSVEETMKEAEELGKQYGKGAVVIFSDPPYFETCNSYYASSQQRDVLASGCDGQYETPDMTGIFVEIAKSLRNNHCASLCILNHCAMLEDYYDGFVALVYSKHYNQIHKNRLTGETFRKITKHMILSNVPA